MVWSTWWGSWIELCSFVQIILKGIFENVLVDVFGWALFLIITLLSRSLITLIKTTFEKFQVLKFGGIFKIAHFNIGEVLLLFFISQRFLPVVLTFRLLLLLKPFAFLLLILCWGFLIFLKLLYFIRFLSFNSIGTGSNWSVSAIIRSLLLVIGHILSLLYKRRIYLKWENVLNWSYFLFLFLYGRSLRWIHFWYRNIINLFSWC